MTRLALARQTEQDGGSRGVGPRDARQAPVPSSHALRGGGKHAASEQNVTAQALRVSSGGSTRTRERRHTTPPAVHAAKPRWQYWCRPTDPEPFQDAAADEEALHRGGDA